jgi:hypothetical protein
LKIPAPRNADSVGMMCRITEVISREGAKEGETRKVILWSYPSRADCVKLSLPLFNQSLAEEPGRKLWLTKRNARIHRARVRRSRTGSTAARHVKGPDKQSNLIVIAATMNVREISELALECAGCYGVFGLEFRLQAVSISS